MVINDSMDHHRMDINLNNYSDVYLYCRLFIGNLSTEIFTGSDPVWGQTLYGGSGGRFIPHPVQIGTGAVKNG